MATEIDFVEDGNILWLAVTKEGSPPVWQNGFNYKQGDLVVPRFPQVGQENVMFQVVGFVGKSGAVEPTFPITEFAKVIDSGIEWRAITKSASPPQLEPSEYFLTTETITVS